MLESGQSPFDPPRSHTATQEWHSFEVRMRRRRAERCVVRAEVALEAGFPDDARAALEEARRLDSSAPDFEELERRLASRAEGTVAQPASLVGEEPEEAAVLAADVPPAPPVAGAEDLPLAVEPPSEVAAEPQRGRRVLRTIAACAAGIVLIAAASFGWRVVRQTAATERRADTTALAANPDVVASAPSTPAPSDRVGIVAHDVVATVRQEPVINREDPRPAGEPAAEAPTASTPDVQRAVAPVDTTVDATPAPLPPAPSTPLAAAPSLPPAPPAPARADVPAPAVATATTGTSEPRAIDESVRVREVLQRYEAAYSRLDAAAARAIWPGVDESALARAFNGLQSQQYSLGRCDVSVAGGSAQATCLGSASWIPKVGSGRTTSRRWQFDLQNAAGDWRIVKAEMR